MGDMIVFGIKIGLVIATAVVFMTAIATLIGLLSEIIFGGVVSEVLGIISACLPFNAGSVFNAVGVVINGILSFLVAAKIWDLTVTAENVT